MEYIRLAIHTLPGARACSGRVQDVRYFVKFIETSSVSELPRKRSEIFSNRSVGSGRGWSKVSVNLVINDRAPRASQNGDL